MENIRLVEEGNDIVIKIDKSKAFGRTSTGKSTIVASSKGWQSIAPGIKLNLLVLKS